MRVKRLRLRQFKRFDDLTIDLGPTPARIVALVGPNGCGKSSVFDAFEQLLQDVKWAKNAEQDENFFNKAAFHSSQPPAPYDKRQSVQVEFGPGVAEIKKTTFHVRSAYRFTPRLDVKQIVAQPDILDDSDRPGSSISLDTRLKENYERLIGAAYSEFDAGKKTGDQVRLELLGEINAILGRVLDVRVSSLGNVIEGRGEFYFQKGNSKDFPYKNLSSGEKEVVDLVVDLVVRRKHFSETIYCIDEPELHLNTSIQRRLLVAIEELIPEGCQLWVATHSVGFLRALKEDLSSQSAILDFSEGDFFSGAKTIKPNLAGRAEWRKIFSTALEDLAGLVAPKQIIYCEGRPDPSPSGAEQGLDAFVYNEVFSKARPDALFVSSGGTQAKQNSMMALSILQKAFHGVELLLLKDMDTASEQDRLSWIAADPSHRMLPRREIENYLLDYSVLGLFCAETGSSISRAQYDQIVTDPFHQDLKLGDTIDRLKRLVGQKGMSNRTFKHSLAAYLRDSPVVEELERAIFGSAGTAAEEGAGPDNRTAPGEG